VGKPEGKRPLGRPRRRWVDNIKMDLREIGWDGVDWTEVLWVISVYFNIRNTLSKSGTFFLGHSV
jgi:hypothetical protein